MSDSYSGVEISPEDIAQSLSRTIIDLDALTPRDTAAVLLLIQYPEIGSHGPIILLNKRSTLVRQAGDLCCPGGRVHKRVDSLLALMFKLPVSPLVRSTAWRMCRSSRSFEKRQLAMLWACCLRESWEEIRLRPWTVRFLGVLSPDRLRLFRRNIFPLVGCIFRHGAFRMNWEVERIVPVPIASLLQTANYAQYKPVSTETSHPAPGSGSKIFPCYRHADAHGEEILWGATYRIVTSFLKRVYLFNPPPLGQRPIIRATLSNRYFTGI